MPVEIERIGSKLLAYALHNTLTISPADYHNASGNRGRHLMHRRHHPSDQSDHQKYPYHRRERRPKSSVTSTRLLPHLSGYHHGLRRLDANPDAVFTPEQLVDSVDAKKLATGVAAGLKPLFFLALPVAGRAGNRILTS